jgi:hypothetical protein
MATPETSQGGVAIGHSQERIGQAEPGLMIGSVAIGAPWVQARVRVSTDTVGPTTVRPDYLDGVVAPDNKLAPSVRSKDIRSRDIR